MSMQATEFGGVPITGVAVPDKAVKDAVRLLRWMQAEHVYDAETSSEIDKTCGALGHPDMPYDDSPDARAGDCDAVRQAVADYMSSEGCTCCQDTDTHELHTKRLAELLDVPPYSDGSGYDFAPFRTTKATP